MRGSVISSRFSSRWAFLVAPMLVGVFMTCSTASNTTDPGPKRIVRAISKGPWEEVARAVDLIASDPTRNAIHVRTGSDIRTLGAPSNPGALEVVPSLREVPAFATAVITDHRAVRWHTADDGWGGVGEWSGSPPGLPEFAILSGILFQTPLEGPGFARPVPVCGVSGIGDGALVAGRGDAAIVVERGRARLLSLETCALLSIDVGTQRVVPVTPAFDPSGDLAALVVEDGPVQGSKRAGRKDGTTSSPFRVLLLGTRTGDVVVSIPVDELPQSLHLAAGSVFVELEDGSGRRLLRHPHAALESPARLRTGMEEAVADLRGRLLDEVRENRERGRVGEAIDRLEVLLRAGLLDAPSKRERRLVAETNRAARARLDSEIRRAVDEGDPFFAALLDRRAALIDGERRLPDGFGVPPLAMSVTADGDSGIDSELVLEELSTSWREMADGCGGLTAAGVPCIELDLATRSIPKAEATRRRMKALSALRHASSRWLSRRGECEKEGPLLYERTEVGPMAASECDLAAESWRWALELEEAWVELARIDSGEEHRLRVRLDEGTFGKASLFRVDEPRVLLDAAVDEALRLQGEMDRTKRWPARSGRLPSLRTFLWRKDGGGRELASVLGADGDVRISPAR